MNSPAKSLRQQVYALLQAAPKPMLSKEIAEQLGTTTHELANTLRNMMHDGVNYPDFYRRRNKLGYFYSANMDAPEPDHPQSPVFADLWRGWGGADRLGSGSADEFFGRLRYEP